MSAGGFDAFHDSIQGGAGDLEIFSSQVRALEQELNTVGMALTGMGALGVGFFALATNESMQFTSAMANVNSIARLTDSELASFEESVIGLSTQFGAVPTDLADGLYGIVSSGFEASEALGILESATVAAGAGMTDTATSAKAITAVLNAYGLEASEAGNVSDVLFKIVDSGVITFEELANNLGNTVPLAAALGVSIEELGAAYSQLTLSGISATQAETQISALMRAAINPTQELTAAVEAYGYESAEAMIAAEGLGGFLIFLAEASGGTSAGLLDLVGTAEAVNAALVLGKDNGAGYAEMLGEMDAAAQNGASTLEVFGIQMDNAAGSVKFAQAEIAAAMIAIGSNLEPLVGMGANVVAGIVGAFNDLSPAAQGAATALGAIGSGTALFAGAAMLALPRVLELIDAMRRLRAANMAGSLMFGPAGLAIAGVTAVLAIGYAAWQNHAQAVRDAEAAYASVGETALEVQDIVNNMKLSGTDLDLAAQIEEINLWTAGMLDAVKTVSEQRFDLSKIFDAASLGLSEDVAAEQIRKQLDSVFGQAFIQWAKENDKLGAETIQILMEGTGSELLKATADIQPLIDEFFSSFDVPPDMHKRVSDNTKQLIDYMMEPLVDSEQVMKDWNAARKEYLEDPLNPDVAGYDAWLKQYLIDLPGVTASATEAAGAISAMDNATQGLNGALATLDPLRGAAENLTEAMAEYNEHVAEVVDNLTRLQEVAGYGDPLSQWNLSGNATDMSLLAMNATQAATALDTVFRVVVGNTDAIASQADSVQKWAAELIGAEGELGKIDQLLADGLITLEQYNAAQGAYNSIAQDTASIQDYVLKIQAMQAPLIAEQTAALENQMEVISNLPAAQQLVALGWMDSTTSMRAMEFQTLAVAAATGKLGENGEKVFASMITGAAAADPVLSALLQDMGLISVGADGTITVHLSGVEGALSEIDSLTVAMITFMDLMDDNELNGSISFEVLGLEDPRKQLEDIDNKVRNLDGYQAELNLLLNTPSGDPANPFPAGFLDLLGNLPKATVYADTGEAVRALDELKATPIEPITIPVSIGTIGNAMGSSAAGMAADVLSDITLTASVDTSTIESDIAALTVAPVTVPVTVDDASVQGLMDTYGSQDGSTLATMYVWAIGDAASAAGMVDTYRGMDGSTLATTYVWGIGDGSSAQGMIDIYSGYDGSTLATTWVWGIGDGSSAQGMIDMYSGYDGSTLATTWVWGIGDGSSALGMIDTLSAYNGQTLATTYVDVVTRQIGGSMAARATGGYVEEDYTLVGELGPELVSLPRGSYVHTSAQSMSMMSGANGGGGVHIAPNAISVTVNAKTDADADEIAITVGAALESAIYQRRAGFGGVR